MITKELLNKNRVLTMSNNRKCDYLIVDVGNNLATMMAVNVHGGTNDILIMKTFEDKSSEEIVNEAYWICKEFDIHILLTDSKGYSLVFIDNFRQNVSDDEISVKQVNIKDVVNSYNNPYLRIEDNLKYGSLRFLQASELANVSYKKPFLGYSNIMQFHKETDELINEISNIKLDISFDGKIRYNKINEDISILRFNCLRLFYSYSVGAISNDELGDIKEKYNVTKRISQYEVIHGTFYKYLFKCIENDGIKVLFYHNGKHKIKQFQNMSDEEKFRDLFLNNIKKITRSKDYYEIVFHNGSQIKFVSGGDSSRGSKCHYAVVDSELSRDIYNTVILPACMLFSRDKDSMGVKDNYFIETVDMWMD